jgi:hypothetical protein
VKRPTGKIIVLTFRKHFEKQDCIDGSGIIERLPEILTSDGRHVNVIDKEKGHFQIVGEDG